jgi:hypothetical protein
LRLFSIAEDGFTLFTKEASAMKKLLLPAFAMLLALSFAATAG